jgi:hypothetical protein
MQGFTVKNYLAAKAKAAIEKIQLRPEPKPKMIGINAGQSNSALLQQLKAWRADMAEEEDLPIYMVLPQKTMYELVAQLPVTRRDLKDIKGFGKKKVQKYGDEIIGIIRSYLQVNLLDKLDEELPEVEPARKPKQEKGQTQRISFEMFKMGKTIEEIARERSLSQTTIEGHLASFIASGDLQIEQFVPVEKTRIISDFFLETGSKSLSEAREVLGEDFSYGELRMVLSYLNRSNTEPPANYIL